MWSIFRKLFTPDLTVSDDAVRQMEEIVISFRQNYGIVLPPEETTMTELQYNVTVIDALTRETIFVGKATGAGLSVILQSLTTLTMHQRIEFVQELMTIGSSYIDTRSNPAYEILAERD